MSWMIFLAQRRYPECLFDFCNRSVLGKPKVRVKKGVIGGRRLRVYILAKSSPNLMGMDEVFVVWGR